MNGLRRLKVVWAATCLVLTSIAVVLLLLATYRPELMHVYAVCMFIAGAALAAMPFLHEAPRNRALIFWVLVIGPIAVADAVTADMPARAAAVIGAGFIGWALWTAAEWVREGFRNR